MENKIVLITGGSKGIGLEAVRRFSAKGYVVITCSRNYENWHQAVATYPELSAVDYQEVDISDREQVATFFDYIKNNYGYLSISVNNASPKIESQGGYAEVSIDSLFSTVISDFWAHAQCLHYELNITEKGGSIVKIPVLAEDACFRVQTGCQSKAQLAANVYYLSKSCNAALASRLSSHRVRG